MITGNSTLDEIIMHKNRLIMQKMVLEKKIENIQNVIKHFKIDEMENEENEIRLQNCI